MAASLAYSCALFVRIMSLTSSQFLDKWTFKLTYNLLLSSTLCSSTYRSPIVLVILWEQSCMSHSRRFIGPKSLNLAECNVKLTLSNGNFKLTFRPVSVSACGMDHCSWKVGGSRRGFLIWHLGFILGNKIVSERKRWTEWDGEGQARIVRDLSTWHAPCPAESWVALCLSPFHSLSLSSLAVSVLPALQALLTKLFLSLTTTTQTLLCHVLPLCLSLSP